MTAIMTLFSLIIWFFIIRWLVRLAFRHPQQSMALFRGARRMLSK